MPKKKELINEKVENLVKKYTPAVAAKIPPINKRALLIRINSVFLMILGMFLALDALYNASSLVYRISIKKVEYNLEAVKKLFSNQKGSHQETYTPNKFTCTEDSKDISFAEFDLEKKPKDREDNNTAKKTTTVIILDIVDKILISITILFAGFSLYESSNLLRTETLSIALKGVDTAVISMVIIAIAMHFLSVVLEDGKDSKISIEYSGGICFLVLCLTVYYFVIKYTSHIEKSKAE